jgi:tellurite resistance protein
MPKELNPDARSLEDAFFARENARLLKTLRHKAEADTRRSALRDAVGIDDEAFLDRLIDLGIGSETALALRLVPLVVVAWADGNIDDREREAIRQAAEKEGVSSAEHAAGLLNTWLARKPDADLMDLWKQSARHVASGLTPGEKSEMRQRLLGSARAVAEAAGGFLGLTSRISPAEQKILEELGKAFD